MLYLNAEGCQVRKHDGPRIQLQFSNNGWSATLQGYSIQDQFLHWSDYCLWNYKVIARSEQLLQGLFLGLEPPKLPALESLYETLTDRNPGGAFFQHPENRDKLAPLTKAFLHEIKWKLTNVATNDWDTDQLEAYYAKHQEFLEHLLVVLETTGGQPARGPEILSVKVYNTDGASRTIYIHQGLLCTIQSYFKARTKSARPFYTVRHFPSCVSLILYQYLLYIRPLVRWTEQDRQIGPEFPEYLWATQANAGPNSRSNSGSGSRSRSRSRSRSGSRSGSNSRSNAESKLDPTLNKGSQRAYWTTKTISAQLRTLSQDLGLSIPLNMQTLRHWVIGFSKRHMLLAPDQSNEAIQELKRVTAHQAGHLIGQHNHNYGTDSDYPSYLQPETLESYYVISKRYFEFQRTLDLDSTSMAWQQAVLAQPMG